MNEKICPVCGAKLSVYYKTGYLGCPDCYSYFKKDIESSIKSIQGSTVHMGKTPPLSEEDGALLDNYDNLLERKRKAKLSGNIAELSFIERELSCVAEELKRRRLL
ncbi:MAG: hypothetical protein SPJ19_07420 [Candidatus Borkfalkiaceae bacterium]|nr:hypothetical protein [Christensenellaceae bacterium]